MELQKLPMRPTHRAVELLVEKTKLSGALRPPFHSTPVCLPGAPWRSLPWFVPFLLVFISPNLSFLSPFPNICLTFCQPARRGEADPREYCLAKEGGIWAQRLLCLGVEHTQQGAGAWFAAPNAFFSSLLLLHRNSKKSSLSPHPKDWPCPSSRGNLVGCCSGDFRGKAFGGLQMNSHPCQGWNSSGGLRMAFGKVMRFI